MSCDIDYRYRRALQPDGLTTFENALRALNEAVDDVRLAGRQAGTCPAVLLLTRHLQRIADGRPTECEADDQALRSQCIERLADLKHRPAIIALIKRGIDYRPEELRHYRREGTRALRQIAAGIGLEHADYRISYYTSQQQLAGEHVLEAEGIYVRISPERFGEPGLAWRNVHIGRITTLTFSATVALRAFESTNERAPKFDLMALSADRRSWVKIGALWEYSSNETGECFLSGQIDDPSLSAPIPVAMFQQNDGSYNVAWRRSKPKASLDGFGSESEGALPPLTATGDEPASDRSVDSAAATGDGLGDSTAPAPKGKTRASVDA